MSAKSDGLKQENIKLKKRIAAFERLFKRMDTGAAALRDIAVMYGSHIGECPKKTGGEACTCQWDQAIALLSYRPQQAAPASVDVPKAEAPAEVPTP